MDNRGSLIRLKFEMNLGGLVNAILHSIQRGKKPATMALFCFWQGLDRKPQ